MLRLPNTILWFSASTNIILNDTCLLDTVVRPRWYFSHFKLTIKTYWSYSWETTIIKIPKKKKQKKTVIQRQYKKCNSFAKNADVRKKF